jgi:hypothetical protein
LRQGERLADVQVRPCDGFPSAKIICNLSAAPLVSNAVVPEVLYLSSAKLSRWPQRQTVRATLLRRGTAEVGGGPIPAKAGIAPETSAQNSAPSIDVDYQRLQRVLDELQRSDRFPRWITDPVVAPGQYVQFDGMMQYGRVRRDRGSDDPARPSANIIFFVGAFGESDELDPTVDVLLGGWIGHLVEHRDLLDRSLRMGSATEHLYDLWDELAAEERRGSFEVPEAWRRLRREPGPNAAEDLESMSRGVYWMMTQYLPSTQIGRLRGFAQVLARLEDDDYDRPLLLGTPLVVEFSDP